MAKPVKYDIPRKWNKWSEIRILDFVTNTYQSSPNPSDEVEALIDAMWDELDTREEVRKMDFPDDWTEDDISVPSYLS